ncbi:MAG: hypothetical protein HOK74_01070 [Nitrosomonadales bacterium]|jgi:hypothetical protein|nr:hypothetical protein [Nitrosomonadales bacterium]
MKTKTLILAILIVFSTASFAQFKLPKNPMGALVGGKKEQQAEPAGDITQIQAKLVNDVADALSEVIDAQALIADAQGDAEKAASLRVTSNTLKGGENRDEAIQGAIQTVKETADGQQEVFSASEKMSDESKALYAKALLPYVKSVLKTTELKDPSIDFLKEAQNEIKSIRNPMQISKMRSSLGTGMYIGKNAPVLIESLVRSSADLLSFAKSNDLDTSEASSMEL